MIVDLGRFAPERNNITIYPNPVIDIATLNINTVQANSKLLTVVTDMQGHIFYKKELVTTQNNIKDKINLSLLSKGTYVVTVYFDGKDKQNIKIIK